MIYYNVTWKSELNDTVRTIERKILNCARTVDLTNEYSWEDVVEAYADLASQVGWDVASYLKEDIDILEDIIGNDPYKEIERMVVDEAKRYIECHQKSSTPMKTSTVS